MRNGIPIRKHSSAIARFTIYILVTVCIFENRNTTYMTRVLPNKPSMQTTIYRNWTSKYKPGISFLQFPVKLSKVKFRFNVELNE